MRPNLNYIPFPFVRSDKDQSKEEEKLQRKVNPKPRLSSKRGARSTSTSKPQTSSDVKTSKYFQSLMKEEIDSEDDFDRPTSAPWVEVNSKKPEKEEVEEEDDDDSEDEDDWEEVEGE